MRPIDHFNAPEPSPTTLAAALRTAGLTLPSSRSLLIASGYLTRYGLGDDPRDWAVALGNLQYQDRHEPEFTDPETRHTLLLITHAGIDASAAELCLRITDDMRRELNAQTGRFVARRIAA